MVCSVLLYMIVSVRVNQIYGFMEIMEMKKSQWDGEHNIGTPLDQGVPSQHTSIFKSLYPFWNSFLHPLTKCELTSDNYQNLFLPAIAFCIAYFVVYEIGIFWCKITLCYNLLMYLGFWIQIDIDETFQEMYCRTL